MFLVAIAHLILEDRDFLSKASEDHFHRKSFRNVGSEPFGDFKTISKPLELCLGKVA